MAGLIVLLLLVNALFIGLGIPLARRKVAQNSWYGVRVGETMANEEVWYETNAVAGREMQGLGWAFTVMTIGLAAVPGISYEAYGAVMAILYSVGAVVLAGRSMTSASKLAKQIKERDSNPNS